MAGGDGPRHRILRAADRLFRRHGYAAVGVDLIAEESGVAKMTLYRKFSAKDDLIVEVLAAEDEATRTWLENQTADIDDPVIRLRTFFDAIESRTGDRTGTGCLFQMAFGEFPDPDHPVHRIARRHKAALREQIDGWVRETGLSDVEATTSQLFALMEGAWASARAGDVFSAHGLGLATTLIVQGGLYAQALASSTNSER